MHVCCLDRGHTRDRQRRMEPQRIERKNKERMKAAAATAQRQCDEVRCRRRRLAFPLPRLPSSCPSPSPPTPTPTPPPWPTISHPLPPDIFAGMIRQLDTGAPVGASGRGGPGAAGAGGPVAPARRAVSGEPDPGSGHYKHVLMTPLLSFGARLQSDRFRGVAGPVARVRGCPAGAGPKRIPRLQKRYPNRISKSKKDLFWNSRYLEIKI